MLADILPKKVSFLKMFSSTKVNKGNPAPSLQSSIPARSPALPCEIKKGLRNFQKHFQIIIINIIIISEDGNASIAG